MKSTANLSPGLLRRLLDNTIAGLKTDGFVAGPNKEPRLRFDGLRISGRTVEYTYRGEVVATLKLDLAFDSARGDTLHLDGFDAGLPLEITS